MLGLAGFVDFSVSGSTTLCDILAYADQELWSVEKRACQFAFWWLALRFGQAGMPSLHFRRLVSGTSAYGFAWCSLRKQSGGHGRSRHCVGSVVHWDVQTLKPSSPKTKKTQNNTILKP